EFQVTVEARVDLAVSLRQQLKDSVAGAEKVTMTDFLVRACALALRKFPEVNSSWVDGRFQRKRSVNIGLAVAPSQGMGLLVPVVHDADPKDIVQISIESRQVIERARSGRPAVGDLSGATFSISNLLSESGRGAPPGLAMIASTEPSVTRATAVTVDPAGAYLTALSNRLSRI